MKKIAFNSLLACSSFLPIIPIVSCSHNDININSNKIVCYAIENVLKPGVNLFIGSIYDALKQSDIEFIENIIKSENRDTFLANVNLCLDTAKNDIANFKSFEVHKKDFIYSDVVLKLFRMNIKKNNSLIDDVKAVLKKDNILSLLNVFIGDGLIDR
ncbi:hypothetical protein FACS189459_1990 [Bacilli bacterium]|nr:hypothetical protein FACS189459_1990 [Bacilli bacterium]